MKALENIRDNLEDLQLEIGRKNGPLVVDLLGDSDSAAVADSTKASADAAPAKKERVWFDENLPQELGLPDEAVSAFAAFFKKDKADSVDIAKAQNEEEEWNPKSTIPSEHKSRLIGSPRPDSTGKILYNGVVNAKLNPFTVFVASIILGIGIDYSIHILGTSQKLMHKYATLEEVLEAAQRKMLKPFILASFTTIAAFLTLLTLGLLGFLTDMFEFGKISIYNVIVIPMALGIGIDATIHMITSWTSDHNKGMNLRQLMDTTGRNVMASSTTTIAGFVGFLFTTHRGLKGIGDLACISIAMFLITSIIFCMYLCGSWLKKK